MRAIIFDFDGVIADSEPIHFSVFQRVLGEQGLFLSREEYYGEYLGYDDKGCFAAFLSSHGRPVSQALIDRLVARKAAAYFEYIKQRPLIFPGVRERVREATVTRRRLAVCSGALRQEIEFILEQTGIRKEFEHITSAEDVIHGKPHPEGFLHALASLNQLGATRIAPNECLVIEDSLPGIKGAQAAGMKVLAVANTHSLDELHDADAVTASLELITFEQLERRLWA